MSVLCPAKPCLPLHLTTLEKFFLLEDRPGFPMTFVIQLSLAGQVDPSAWEQALCTVLEYQPLLSAHIGRGKGGQQCWVNSDKPVPACTWGDLDRPMACPNQSEHIDLARETGLRVWVQQGAERAVVTLQFHHACTDGIGAYRFIGEVLAAYGLLMEGPEHYALTEIRGDLLRGRFQRALGRHVPSGMRTTLRALRYGYDLYRKRPATLAAPTTPSMGRRAETAFPGYCSYSFDAATHQRLRKVAARHGVMLNDLLMRDLFLTLREWERPHHWRFAHPQLRVMMPTNLRDTEDCAMPASSMVGYTFATRTIADCASPDELLHGIGAETARIKHQRSGADFLETLLVADHLPGLLSYVIPTHWSLCTAVLSNVADPSRRFTAKLPRAGGRVRAGNLVLEDITGVPPYRPKTRTAVSIFQYDRRLTICLRCDPQLYRLQDAERLLKMYADQLRLSAEDQRGTAQ